MIQCPICQESLVRNENEVNNLLKKLLAVSKKADIEQLLHAIRQEAESDSDESEDEHDLFYLSTNLTNPTRIQRFLNHLQRPSQMVDYVKRFYSKLVAVKCGHCFHFSCLQQWCYIRKTNTGPLSTCPMCRERFTLGEAFSIFPTLTENIDLEAVEMNHSQVINRGPQVLLRWQRKAVQKLKNCIKGVWTHGKTKFTANMTLMNEIVQQAFPAPLKTNVIRYGIPVFLFLVFLVHLCFIKNLTSYNYEIQDAADEIEEEIRLESGQFLNCSFAIVLFFLCVFCAVLDLLHDVLQK